MRIVLTLCLTAMALTLRAPADDFKLEDGFKLMIDKDLTGWKQLKDGASLDGKSEAYGKRFTLKDGVLKIDPAVKGDVRIETAKSFGGDLTIRFDFKPDDKCNNDLFLRGVKFDIKKGDAKYKEGEWNQFEIAIKGETATYSCNGEKAKDFKLKGGATPFGLRAEFGGIEIKNLRIKE